MEFFFNNHIAAFETKASLIPQMLQSKQTLKHFETYYIGALCTHYIRDWTASVIIEGLY